MTDYSVFCKNTFFARNLQYYEKSSVAAKKKFFLYSY